MKNTTDPYDYYSFSENLPYGFFIVDNMREITPWKKAGERYWDARRKKWQRKPF